MKNKFIAILLVGFLLCGCGTAEVEQKELEKEQRPEEAEITNFDEVDAKPEVDDKLSKSIKIYNDEIEGEISNFVNGNTGDIKVDRIKTSESRVEYIFSQGDKELFRTPQLENYNSFEYIQFCDINADKVPEILVASYVQNSAGYEVKEFYVYKEKDSSWKELASYNLDADGQIKSLLETRIDIGDAALDVELSEKGIEIIASIGSRATDDDGDYWEWENYHATIAER